MKQKCDWCHCEFYPRHQEKRCPTCSNPKTRKPYQPVPLRQKHQDIDADENKPILLSSQVALTKRGKEKICTSGVYLKPHTCKKCGKIIPKVGNKKYCDACAVEIHNERVKKRYKRKIRYCEKCNKLITGNGKKYCLECAAIARKESRKRQKQKKKVNNVVR